MTLTPEKILIDELSSQRLCWDEIVIMTAGLNKPEAYLDLADWSADHRGCSREEMREEAHRLIRKYNL